MREAHLGIDCGTRSTRAVPRDAGEVVGVGRAAHGLVQGEDGTREDPGLWIEAARSAIGEALSGPLGQRLRPSARTKGNAAVRALRG